MKSGLLQLNYSVKYIHKVDKLYNNNNLIIGIHLWNSVPYSMLQLTATSPNNLSKSC